MLRLLGAALVLVGGWGLGAWAVARRQRRLQLMQDIGSALAALQREISCRALPWPQACRIAAEAAGTAREMLLCAASGSCERAAGEAWRSAVAPYIPHLPAEAVAALQDLAAALGRSDLAEQLAALTAARQRLEAARGEERQICLQKRRITLHLGWSLGLLLVLIFW
ncbi:MAG: stage III sporulation protein AB [Firmicutes bacterium]|nr:stage III sporulation protein AB [Bacillota bacterium]